MPGYSPSFVQFLGRHYSDLAQGLYPGASSGIRYRPQQGKGGGKSEVEEGGFETPSALKADFDHAAEAVTTAHPDRSNWEAITQAKLGLEMIAGGLRYTDAERRHGWPEGGGKAVAWDTCWKMALVLGWTPGDNDLETTPSLISEDDLSAIPSVQAKVDLALRIREARDDANLTNGELAARLKKNVRMVQRWMSAEVAPDASDLVRLADTFGVEIVITGSGLAWRRIAA